MEKHSGVELVIRTAHESELGYIAALEENSFPDPWSVKSLTETFAQNHALILTGWQNGELAGYVIFYHVLDEGEIARIAVDPSLRRLGTATQLMDGLEKYCAQNNILKIMLDVRESNLPAISFYKKCNFLEDGIRKRFYENPEESAVLMSKELGK